MNDDRTGKVAELSEQYGRMVFATAYRITGNTDDAEDALQDVFLKLIDSWKRLNPDSIRDWGAYLRVMASRSAIDVLRRSSRWRHESVDIAPEIEDPNASNPQAAASQRQIADILRKALRTLPERDAQIFALRYFEDFSYETIAEQMKMNANHVGVILHRARARLQEILQPVVTDDVRRIEQPISLDRTERIAKENSHVEC